VTLTNTKRNEGRKRGKVKNEPREKMNRAAKRAKRHKSTWGQLTRNKKKKEKLIKEKQKA
jgi:hypothetical protein